MKRDLRYLLALAAAAPSVVAPASPAHAAPGCGGAWTNYAVCAFEAPGGAFVISVTAADGEQGPGTIGSVSVRAYIVIAGIQHNLGSCANRGPTPVTCSALVNTRFTGHQHYCEVFGVRSGTYACVDPPRLPAPDLT
jgi:hypothetical protein